MRFPASNEPCSLHELPNCRSCSGVRLSYGRIRTVEQARYELRDIEHFLAKNPTSESLLSDQAILLKALEPYA